LWWVSVWGDGVKVFTRWGQGKGFSKERKEGIRGGTKRAVIWTEREEGEEGFLQGEYRKDTKWWRRDRDRRRRR